MADNKDYSNLALEELLAEEKKIKRKETLSAAIIGFLVGIIVYAVAKNGIGFRLVALIIPLILMYGVYKNSQSNKQDLEQIRAEINARSTL